MMGLYNIHSYKTDEVVGQLWLGRDERHRLQTQRQIQLRADTWDGRMLAIGPMHTAEQTYTVYTVTLALDIPRHDTREWRVYCMEGEEHLGRVKTEQESKMRFPVPISLFPG